MAALACCAGLLVACSDSSESVPVEFADGDGDGLVHRDDCDDSNSEIGSMGVFYPDADGDGLGSPVGSMEACAPPTGYVTNADDLYPDCATNDLDICGRCAGPGQITYYADSDGDGLGDSEISVQACAQPDAFVTNSDDLEPNCATNNTDSCGICAGPGGLTYYADVDGDGRGDARIPVESCIALDGFVTNADDAEPECATDDTDECGVCAGVNRDKDCLGVCFGAAVVDDCGVCGGPGTLPFYADADEDELGDPNDTVLGCEQPEGFVLNADDLEPNCATNNTDSCGVCAGLGRLTYYADIDEDGLGDLRTPVMGCERPEGFVLNADDLEPNCTTNNTDGCGVCAGADADQDCNQECFGEAFLDLCERCVGGSTGLTAATEDSDGDELPDMCDDDCLAHSRFIIQWTDVPLYSRQQGGVGSYTFQAILYSNGDIVFQYQDFDEYNANATVGIQNNAGQGVIEFSYNNAFVTETPSITMFRDRNDRFIADYSIPRYWLDIREVGEELTEMSDDDARTTSIGFDFPFWNQTRSSLYVSANGFLLFGEPFDNNYNNTELPNGNLPALIAPLWDDFNPTAGGTVHVYRAGPTCETDCNDVVGGLAYEEEGCGSCVTGLENGPADDCNGDCGGTAQIDGCGICAGGETGIDPQALDCTGTCGGTAFYDDCRTCVGGDTGLEPTPAEECPRGPDLLVDGQYLSDTLYIDYINVQENDCLIGERCVRGSGERKLIRFGTRIANIGNEDLQVGRPNDDQEFWHYDECHNHYHYEAYAAYQIFDVAANEMLDIGSKNGFCVLDWAVWDTNLLPDDLNNQCRGYNCGNQGITAGCEDTYTANLQCQWIDVTGMPDGEYDVIVTTNPEGEIAEISLDNNSASIRVNMVGDTLTVIGPTPEN